MNTHILTHTYTLTHFFKNVSKEMPLLTGDLHTPLQSYRMLPSLILLQYVTLLFNNTCLTGI